MTFDPTETTENRVLRRRRVTVREASAAIILGALVGAAGAHAVMATSTFAAHLVAQPVGEVPTLPAQHSDSLLYLMNGGVILSVVAAFFWMLRTDLPRREAENRQDRERAAALAAANLEHLADEHRSALEKIADTFRDESAAQREACAKEQERAFQSFEKSINRLETRIAIADAKPRRGRTEEID